MSINKDIKCPMCGNIGSIRTDTFGDWIHCKKCSNNLTKKLNKLIVKFSNEFENLLRYQ